MPEMMARVEAEDFDTGLPPDGPLPGGWSAARPRVVVVGGGFAGLRAVRELRRAGVEVTLLDRRNFHLFQPLLYQVASGALSPGEIAYPLRGILARQPNARVLMAEVAAIDLTGRRVRLRPQPGGVGAVELPYDWLIVATGARHSYFGHDGWARHAPGLKTVEDALEIRRRVLSAQQPADRLGAAVDDELALPPLAQNCQFWRGWLRHCYRCRTRAGVGACQCILACDGSFWFGLACGL